MIKLHLFLFLFLFLPQIQAKEAYISIIIDDIGYIKKSNQQAIALSGDLAFAILPHTPFATFFATKIHQQQREILLHLPMQTLKPSSLDAGLLTEQMNYGEFRHQLDKNFQAVPYFTGINNHRGSRLTANKSAMIVLMDYIKKQDRSLFFIDSRTNHQSVAADMAQKFNIPHTSRDIFLDNILTIEAVQQQFDRLIRLAKKKGKAVAIGHPHQVTLNVLKKNLKRLDELGVKLVFPSVIIKQRAN